MNYKRIISVLLILMLTLSMVACNNDVANNQADETAETTESTDTQYTEQVELEEKVVIYSTHGEAMLELVADEFTKATGVEVEFINLKGELADRVRAEKENPQSDVMFGGSSAVFMELQEEDLFEAYAPSWNDKVDELFKDKDNFWIGTIQTPVMICYNTDVITEEDAPKDWADLTNPALEGQLVFRNALSSSARATYSSLLQQFEANDDLENGWAYLSALDGNTKQYYSSGSMMFQAIGRQEAGVTFATLNSIVDNKVNNNIPLEIVNAESGSPIITDGIAMIKNAKNPNAAKAFIDFAGSAEMQAMLANEFNRMPTNKDAFASSPEWMAEIVIAPMNVDWAALAITSSEWMQQWDTEVKDANKDAE